MLEQAHSEPVRTKFIVRIKEITQMLND